MTNQYEILILGKEVVALESLNRTTWEFNESTNSQMESSIYGELRQSLERSLMAVIYGQAPEVARDIVRDVMQYVLDKYGEDKAVYNSLVYACDNHGKYIKGDWE